MSTTDQERTTIAVLNDRPHRLYGMQRTSIEISEILVRAGHDVVYVTFGDGLVVEEVARRNLTVRIVDTPDRFRRFDRALVLGGPATLLAATRDAAVLYRRLEEVLRDAGVSTVLAMTNRVGLYAPILRLRGFRVVVYGQNTVPLGWRALPLVVGASSLPQMSPRAREVFPGLLRRVFAAKFPLLPLGIDLEPFRGSAGRLDERGDAGQRSIRVLSIAKISERKGTELMIESVREARRRGASLSLTLVGDAGTAKDQLLLDRLRSDASLEDFVVFAGWQDDVVPFLESADIGLIASFEEGGPRVLFEMMAAGLPVVSTDVGFTAEVLGSGAAGFVVDRSTDSIVSKLVQLADDAGLRLEMGREARRLAGSHYTLEVFERTLAGLMKVRT